jgi:hypothetical protein
MGTRGSLRAPVLLAKPRGGTILLGKPVICGMSA